MPYCIWDTSKIALDYHNNEWGVPLYDDIKHFEYLSMEVMQCGLSWKTILLKRQILNLCFDNFNWKFVDHFMQNGTLNENCLISLIIDESD